MSDTVPISVLVEDTGETTRTLQHWSDLGILRPLPATHKQGRGRYREFPVSVPWQGERAWALLASALNRLRVPLGDIRLILDDLREAADFKMQASGGRAFLIIRVEADLTVKHCVVQADGAILNVPADLFPSGYLIDLEFALGALRNQPAGKWPSA